MALCRTPSGTISAYVDMSLLGRKERIRRRLYYRVSASFLVSGCNMELKILPASASTRSSIRRAIQSRINYEHLQFRLAVA